MRCRYQNCHVNWSGKAGKLCMASLTAAVEETAMLQEILGLEILKKPDF